jgi:hypothetical protein
MSSEEQIPSSDELSNNELSSSELSSSDEQISCLNHQVEIEFCRMNKCSHKINDLQNKLRKQRNKHEAALKNYVKWNYSIMDIQVNCDYFDLKNRLFEQLEEIAKKVSDYEQQLEEEKETYSLAKDSLELISNYIHMERNTRMESKA